MPSLEITTMIGCPLRCTFCPQDSLRTAYGRDAAKYMSLETFRTVLAKLPKHVRVDFSGMAEPWSNPRATDMLELTLDAGYRVAIYTTLYGMNREDCWRTIRLLRRFAGQIETVCLHLPDKRGNMRGWRHSPEWEANLLDFAALSRERLFRFEAMTMDGGGQVHESLAHLGITTPAWELHTRAGNVTDKDVGGQAMTPPPSHAGPVACSFTPFMDQNVLLPNGDVLLCCMDYSSKHRLGNLLEQDYYDIFAGQEMGRLRAENTRAEFSDRSLCRSCNRAVPHALPHGNLIWQPVRV